MLVENDLKKLFQELAHHETAEISIGGVNMKIHVFDHASKIHLTSPVYFGGNYIPKSVRQCITQKAPFDELLIKTYLTIEEGAFQVFLHYIGGVEALTRHQFKELLEHFSFLSDEWRLFLDKHDKNDLIHIRQK
jgi:hypothetical protein